MSFGAAVNFYHDSVKGQSGCHHTFDWERKRAVAFSSGTEVGTGFVPGNVNLYTCHGVRRGTEKQMDHPEQLKAIIRALPVFKSARENRARAVTAVDEIF